MPNKSKLDDTQMSGQISLKFESKLSASHERVWKWITSFDEISAEMWPFFRMTAPKQIRSIEDVCVKLGTPLFRSYVFLFGFLPIDYSDITLIELQRGQGFVEQSHMGSMKLWRHERRILSDPAEPSAVLLVDKLTFQPRFATGVVSWFIRRVFEHRHAVLRAKLGAV